MIALLQRVNEAGVEIGGSTVGKIGPGLLVLLGVSKGDTAAGAEQLAKKCCELRVFEDDANKMNLSLIDKSYEMLVVSQFTLAADCRKGRRPSFDNAAEPAIANELYERFCDACRERGIKVQTGKFAAYMQVSLVNDGPVTFILDTGCQPQRNP